MIKPIFKLFACCIPVKGPVICIICDLQRNQYLMIPEGIYDILTSFHDWPMSDIKQHYNNEFDEVIDEYVQLLEEQEYGFWTTEPGRFPALDLHYETPAIINNAIIDNYAGSNHNYDVLINDLSTLRCNFLELRFYDEESIAAIKDILYKTRGSRLRNVDLYIKYTHELTPEYIITEIFHEFPIVGHVFVHSAPLDKNFAAQYNYLLFFIKQIIHDESCCGIITQRNFNVNLQLFTEALQFNTCLNKKVSIDKEGNIKNCPSMKHHFGHHSVTSILDIVQNSTDFRMPWSINKDQVEVCRDCQFRYICTDCRAYLDNTYAKPAKCTYDPYTNTWAGATGNMQDTTITNTTIST
jgi:SPASM domain peptide maturase of grasp-with-spasm system